MGTKTYYVLMGLTYSNNALGYKNARKNNNTKQLENKQTNKRTQLELFTII